MNKATKENKKSTTQTGKVEEKNPPKSKSRDKATKKEEKPAKDKTKKASVSKEKKDGPKKPKNNYFYFAMEVKDRIVKANPGIKPKEIMKQTGDEWKKLTDGDKKKYNEMAAKDKERYLKECESMGSPAEKGGAKKKKADEKTESMIVD